MTMRARNQKSRKARPGGLCVLLAALCLAAFSGSAALGRAIISNLELSVSPFSPNGDGHQDTTDIGFTLSEAATVGVHIYDMDGLLRHTVAAPQSMPGGLNTVTYGGEGTPDMADGEYMVRAETELNDAFSHIRTLGGLAAVPYGIDYGRRTTVELLSQTQGTTAYYLGTWSGNNLSLAQSFTPDVDMTVRMISIRLRTTVGGITDPITISICPDNGGFPDHDNPLATTEIASPVGDDWNDAVFASDVSLAQGTTYYLTASTPDQPSDIYYQWQRTTPSAYPGGHVFSRVNEDAWTTITNYDLAFALFEVLDNPSAYVYVTDLVRHRVYQYTDSGDLVMSIGAVTGNCNGCFNNPYDVGVDSGGNIYVADRSNHRIEKFDSNGNYIDTFGQTGTAGSGLDPLQFNLPRGLFVTKTGLAHLDRIYVADYSNNRIVRLLTTGEVDTAWGGAGGSAPGVLDLTTGNTNNPSNCGAPMAVAVDATDADAVWVACWSPWRVRRYDSMGHGAPFPDIYAPYSEGLAVADGKVFLSQYQYNRTQVYNAVNGAQISSLANRAGGGSGLVNRPGKVAINDDGNVLIADQYNSRVQELSVHDGAYIGQFTAMPDNEPNLYHPQAIALDPADDSFYVTSSITNLLIKLDKNGIVLWKKGAIMATGDSDNTGSLSSPRGVAVDADGNVYVADYGYDRVMKYDSAGNYLLQIASSGTGDGQVRGPTDVGVDSDGNVYVVDIIGATDRLQKFNSLGLFQAKVDPGILDNPYGLSVIGDGTTGKVFVADYNNQRIAVYNTADLSAADAFACAGACTNPYYVTVYPSDSTGSLYISSWSLNAVVKMSQTGAVQGVFGGSGHGDDQFYYPSGTAFTSRGNMWVANRGTNTTTQAPHNIKEFAMRSIATKAFDIDTTRFRLQAASPQTAGTPFNITVTAEDRFGNTLTGYTGSAALSSDGAGTLTPGTITFGPAHNGVRIVSASYNLTGSINILAQDLMDQYKREAAPLAVDFNPGALASFTVEPDAYSQTAGQSFNVTITAYDALGNIKTDYTGTAGLTADGAGTLGGTTTADFDDADPADGQTTVSVHYSEAGTARITAAAGPISGESAGIVFSPSTLDHFDVNITSPQTAGQGFNVHLVARDSLANKVSGFTDTVVFTVDSGGNTADLSPTQSLSFIDGEAWAALTYLKTGTITIKAEHVGTSSSGVSGAVAFNPDTVSYLDVAATSPQIAGQAFGVQLTARDQWGNTVTDFSQAIDFAKVGGAGDLTPTDSTGYSFSSGVMTLSMTYTKPLETIVVSAESQGAPAVSGQSGEIEFLVGTQTLTNFDVQVSTATPTAGGSFNITITALDQDELVMPFVGFVNLSHNGTGLLMPAQLTIGVADAGTKTVAATYSAAESGVLITAANALAPYQSGVSPALDFQPGTVNAAACQVSASASVTADGVSQSEVVVTLKDLFGNPVPGKSVTINSSRSSDVITQPTALTDADGRATGYAASTVAGTSTISALNVTDGVDLTGLVSDDTEFVPGPVDHFILSASTPQVINQQFNLTVTAKDAFNNTVTAYAGTVDLDADGTGTLTPDSTTGFTNGVKTQAVSYSALGLITITAEDPALSRQGTASPITIANAVVDSGLSTIEASPTVTADGVSASTVTITLRDSSGNGLPDKAVVINSSRSADAVTQPSQLTDADGRTTATVTSATAGTSTFTALDITDNVWLADSAQTQFTPGDLDQFTLSAASPQVRSEPFVLSITARDANNNVITGFAGTVNLSVDGDGTITPDSTSSFSAGVASITVRYDELGVIYITATDAATGRTGVSPAVDIRNAVVSADLSTIEATDQVAANGVSESTVTVTLLDTAGAGVPGKSIVVVSTRNNDVVTQPSQLTDAAGRTTATVTSTTAGTSTFTARSVTHGLWLTDTAQTVFQAGPVAGFQVQAGAVQSMGGNFAVALTAIDADGNRAYDYTGSAALTHNGSGTLTAPAGVEFAAGTAAAVVSYDTAETIRITATDPDAGVSGTSDLVAVVNQSLQALDRFQVQAPAQAEAGQRFTVTITALDEDGEAVSAYTGVVALMADGSGELRPEYATFTPAHGGVVAVDDVRYSAAETITITAVDPVSQVNGSSGPVAVSPTTVSAIDSSVAAVSPVPASGADMAAVVVELVDVLGNPVPGKAVTLSTSRPGHDIIAQPTTVTDAQGRTAGGVYSSVVGGSTISAYVVDQGITLIQTPTVEFSAYSEQTITLEPGQWRMLAFSLATADPVTAIFAGAAAYRIQNGELVSDPALLDHPRPGVSYFLYADVPITATVTGVPSAQGHADLDLTPGWNQVGNPFTARIDWNDSVLVAEVGSNRFLRLSAAESLGWIDNIYYLLSDGEYRPALADQALALEELQGILIYASRSLRLRIADPGE